MADIKDSTIEALSSLEIGRPLTIQDERIQITYYSWNTNYSFLNEFLHNNKVNDNILFNLLVSWGYLKEIRDDGRLLGFDFPNI